MAHRHGGHGGHGSSGHSREKLLRNGVVAGVVFIVLLAGFLLLGSLLEPEVEEEQGSLEGRFEPTLTLEHEGKTYTHQEQDYSTILFIGVDKTALGSASLRSAGQADFLLLMTIDRENREVDMLQIDRDTISDVRIYGAFGQYAGSRRTQMCLAYAFGTTPEKACQNTVRAVTDFLGGIPIDHYVALDMDGMVVLNDALGGVTVTLEEDMSDLDPEMKKGATITLKGQQAEYFLRTRMTVGDGSNASRMLRQSAFMEAAASLIYDKLAEDANFISVLLEKMDEHLVTSCEDAWLINQAYAARKYNRTQTVRLDGEHTIGEDGFVEFHPDTNALKRYIISTFCE